MTDSKPRQCFYIPPDQHDENGYIPSLVTEGQPGHVPLKGNGPFARPWYWGHTLAEAQATANRENRGTFGLSPDEALEIVLSSVYSRGSNQVHTTYIRDAEIRVHDREPGTDDASDMYVIEVLGVTVIVRLVTIEDEDDEGEPVTRTEPKIMVKAGGQFAVGVNDDVNTYGDG